eukprot:80860-Rhodomonas_salina.2
MQAGRQEEGKCTKLIWGRGATHCPRTRFARYAPYESRSLVCRHLSPIQNQKDEWHGETLRKLRSFDVQKKWCEGPHAPCHSAANTTAPLLHTSVRSATKTDCEVRFLDGQAGSGIP